MTTETQLLDRDEYNELIERLVEEHPEAVEAEAFTVATTMILSPPIVEEEIAVTYGTPTYSDVVLYPLNVLQCTEQTINRIVDHSVYHGRDLDEDWAVNVAHVAFELDLLDALERNHLESNTQQ